MRALLLCALAVACGCTSRVPEQKVEQASQERKANVAAFRGQFDPLHQQLLVELNKPDFGQEAAYSQVEADLSKLANSIAAGPLEGEERRLVSADQLTCTTASIYLSPFSDPDVKATEKPLLEKAKANAQPCGKLEHLASAERVRFEMESKPIEPSQIKIGARIVDGETGSQVGYITNADYRKGDKVFVCIAKAKDGSADTYIERHRVESGVDYRLAD